MAPEQDRLWDALNNISVKLARIEERQVAIGEQVSAIRTDHCEPSSRDRATLHDRLRALEGRVWLLFGGLGALMGILQVISWLRANIHQ